MLVENYISNATRIVNFN